MADVAADNQVIEATPVDEVKETLKEATKEDVTTAEEASTGDVAPEAASEGVKETENGTENGNGTTEEAPKENGSAKEENGHSTSENGDADAERKRKSEVGDDVDGAIEVSSEKKAKLEEKSEDAVAETPSNGEAEVVA